MHLPIPSSYQHIKPYHYHHHILVQFIIAELIVAFREVQEIDQLVQGPDQAAHNENFIKLAKHLTLLTGSHLTYARMFYRHKEGMMEKIKNYSAFLCHMAGHLDPKRNEMHKLIKQAMTYSFEALENMKHVPKDCRPEEMSVVIIVLKKMNRIFAKILSLLKDIILQFRYNENILFFLLKYRKDLDHIYQDSFVRKTFYKCFSKDLRKAQDFLIGKYKARGFEYMIPRIKTAFAEIKE